ncbi:MAG: hypothetical protein R3A45_07810 [Bdellovibrionota bacterium]
MTLFVGIMGVFCTPLGYANERCRFTLPEKQIVFLLDVSYSFSQIQLAASRAMIQKPCFVSAKINRNMGQNPAA